MWSSTTPTMNYLPHFQELIGQQLVRLLDSISKCLQHHTFSNMIFDKIFETHYVQILSCFGFGANVWFTTQITFLAFQLFFPSFSTMFWNVIWITTSFNYMYFSMCMHTSYQYYRCPPFTLRPQQWVHGHPWCNLRHFCCY